MATFYRREIFYNSNSRLQVCCNVRRKQVIAGHLFCHETMLLIRLTMSHCDIENYTFVSCRVSTAVRRELFTQQFTIICQEFEHDLHFLKKARPLLASIDQYELFSLYLHF